MPQTFVDCVEMLVPELRKRGLFWSDYCVPGATYRENLFEMPGQREPFPDHPAASMIWRPSEHDHRTTNGVNGYANGHYGHEDDGDTLDPTSMQLT